jgi:hypothetical protein
VEGSFELGNNSLGSIKCWEILEWPRDWRPLKKDSAHGVSEIDIARL